MYVAALRSIAARSSSDTSRRTLPGTPATSTPSGTCCPSASTVPAAMIERRPPPAPVEQDRAHADQDQILHGAPVQRRAVADGDL